MRQALAARAGDRGEGDEFERAMLDPPGGRMLPVVLQRVAAAFGAPPEQVAAMLFPSRRRRS